MQAYFFSAPWGKGGAMMGNIHICIIICIIRPKKNIPPAFFRPAQISGVVKALIQFQMSRQCPAE
jgi:hypothetical protein